LSLDTVADLVLQPNGKIIIGGSTGGDFAIKRFNSNGSADTTFNSNLFSRGLVQTDFVGTDYCTDLVRLASGKVLAVGYGADGNLDSFMLMARYLTN
jgi:hypothetical protein